MTRTCVGCRRHGPKDSFVRIRRTPSGGVEVDAGGKAPGRGAYVCPDVRCLEQALRRGRLGRALRTPLEAADAVRLAASFERTLDGEGARGAR